MQQPIKILTIEDEEAVRTSVVAYLEDLGYQLIEAADGVTGLALFEQEQPDLVLCDLRLPRVDGLDVLSAIVDSSAETPVIVVSGANLMSDAIQAIKRGAWDYISKPIVDMELLDSAIQRALDRARLVQENRQHLEHLEQLNRELTQAVEQLKEDEEAARQLQTRMLPEADVTLGRYRFRQRIFSSMYLSGDFLDFFRITEQTIGFYMADVSGHGAASALVTVMLKTLFEKYRERQQEEGDETLLQPDEMLSHLNQDLCQLQIDKFSTIFYGVLQCDSNLLRYSSGGQFPHPILLDATGTQALTGHDQPVGLFDDALYTTHQLQLPEKFLLLLVSDGILELFPRDSARQRSKLLMEQVSGMDFALERLIDRYQISDRSELPDDIALLTLSRGWGDE